VLPWLPWLPCSHVLSRDVAEDWTYIDAFYFSVITLTTVGLGDFVPSTGPGIKFAYLYCMVSQPASFSQSTASSMDIISPDRPPPPHVFAFASMMIVLLRC
jgi:hypothetical protein